MINERKHNLGFLINFVFSNLVWVATAFTLIGIPIATVGLFAMMSQFVRGEQPEFFKVFLEAIRQNWIKALAVGLIDLAAGAFVFINLSIMKLMNATDILVIFSRSLTITSAVVLITANIYIWFLMANTDLSLKALIKFALILVVTYPLRSLIMTIATLLPIIVSYFLPPLILLFVTISASAYIASLGAWIILQKHLTAQELETLNLLPIPAEQD